MSHRNSFSEAKQLELEDAALKNCEHLIRDFVLKGRRKCEIGMFHQMLWEQHIIPSLDASLEVQPVSDCG